MAVYWICYYRIQDQHWQPRATRHRKIPVLGTTPPRRPQDSLIREHLETRLAQYLAIALNAMVSFHTTRLQGNLELRGGNTVHIGDQGEGKYLEEEGKRKEEGVFVGSARWPGCKYTPTYTDKSCTCYNQVWAREHRYKHVDILGGGVLLTDIYAYIEFAYMQNEPVLVNEPNFASN